MTSCGGVVIGPVAPGCGWAGIGEESVGGWLTLTHLGTPDGVVIQTPDYSGSPSCIKRKGSVQGTDPVFGTAKVTVYAVEPGCIVPP